MNKIKQEYFNLNLKPIPFYKTIRDKSLTTRISHKKLSIDLSNFNTTKPKSLSKLTHNDRPVRTPSMEKIPSTNFLKTFLNLEKKSQNLLNILNKKWDKPLEDSLKIFYTSKFQALLSERHENVTILFNEVAEILLKFSPESEEQRHLIDLMRLAFSEQNEIISFYDLFHKEIKNIYSLKTESSKSNTLVSMSDKSHNDFQDLSEIMRLLLKILFKKFTDLTVVLENKDEKLWFNRINELKMKFRLDKKDSGELVKMIEDFETLINELISKIMQLNDEKQHLNLEYTAIKKIYEKSYVLSKIETKEILLKPKKESDTAKINFDYFNKFETLYKKATEDMRTRNDELLEELTKTKISLEEKQNFINEIMKKKKIERKRQKKEHEDKEIQINLYTGFESPVNTPCLHPKTNPLSNYLSINLNAHNVSSLYINSIMSLMLSDKLYDDYQDYFDRNPVKPLKDYIFEWFLQRFGNQTFAESMMKDFLASILYKNTENDRYFIFSKFCGINLESFNVKYKKNDEKIDEFLLKFEESQDKTSEIMNSYYSSSNAISLYIKLAYFHKFLEIPDQDPDQYRPLLPLNGEEASLIPFEHAETLIKNILMEEFPEDFGVLEMVQIFQTLVVNEKIPRIVRKGGFLASGTGSPIKRTSIGLAGQRRSIDIGSPGAPLLPTTKSKASDFLIPFDILARFLVDNLANFFDKKMEIFINSLRLQQSNRKINDFFIEDYFTVIGKQFPSKSNRWLVSSFANFLINNKSHGFSNIQDMAFNNCEALLRNDFNGKFYLENYYKKEKKNNEDIGEMILNSQDRSPKKKKTGLFGNIKKAPSLAEERKITNAQNSEEIKVIYEKNYDYVNSIIILNETYLTLREYIKKEELVNEVLYMSHEVFKKEITKFPHNLHLVKSNFWNKFVGFDRNDLVARVENCWKTLRLMIDCVFSRGEKHA